MNQHESGISDVNIALLLNNMKQLSTDSLKEVLVLVERMEEYEVCLLIKNELDIRKIIDKAREAFAKP